MSPVRKKSEQLIVFRGGAVKIARLAAGLTATQLAERLQGFPECAGVDKTVISNWERGKVRPGLVYALALEEVLLIPVRDLFDWPGK